MFGAVQLAFAHDLIGGKQVAAIAPETGVNRAAKADRATVPVSAGQSQTISLRPDGLADTSVLVRVPVAKGKRGMKRVIARRRRRCRKPGGQRKDRSPASRSSAFLTEVAKLLEPGRCVTEQLRFQRPRVMARRIPAPWRRMDSRSPPDGQITIEKLSSRANLKNISLYPFGQITATVTPIPPRKEGRIMIVTNVGRVAVDAAVPTDERHERVRRSRVVLTSRCWRQVLREATLLGGDGGKKAVLRGEHVISRKAIAQGMSDASADLYARVRISCTHCT